jgi:hypothetical protein
LTLSPIIPATAVCRRRFHGNRMHTHFAPQTTDPLANAQPQLNRAIVVVVCTSATRKCDSLLSVTLILTQSIPICALSRPTFARAHSRAHTHRALAQTRRQMAATTHFHTIQTMSIKITIRIVTFDPHSSPHAPNHARFPHHSPNQPGTRRNMQ